jgi:hypothetical protein
MKSLTKFLAASLSIAAFVLLLPSCVTTPEKKHVYDFGDEEQVTQLPHTRPESYEGNPFGNMPQSR